MENCHLLNHFDACAYQIRNSVKLKRIMQTILSLGNALNHGTARGELNCQIDVLFT